MADSKIYTVPQVFAFFSNCLYDSSTACSYPVDILCGYFRMGELYEENKQDCGYRMHAIVFVGLVGR